MGNAQGNWVFHTAYPHYYGLQVLRCSKGEPIGGSLRRRIDSQLVSNATEILEQAMKLRGVDHIDMIVKDLAKSIEYYRKFGMHVEGTVDAGETVFLWNGDDDDPVRIELHKQKEGETLGIDHLSFLVDDPVQAQKEVEFLGGVEFLFKPFENQQSGRTISNSYDPDGVQIQMAHQTGAGTYKNWE